MGILARLLDAVKAHARAMDGGGRNQLLLDGDVCMHRALDTGDVQWTLDLKDVEEVLAYVQTTRARDHVSIRLRAKGRDFECDDDATGFSNAMAALERIVGRPLLGEALDLALPAYGASRKVLWRRGDTSSS